MSLFLAGLITAFVSILVFFGVILSSSMLVKPFEYDVTSICSMLDEISGLNKNDKLRKIGEILSMLDDPKNKWLKKDIIRAIDTELKKIGYKGGYEQYKRKKANLDKNKSNFYNKNFNKE